MTGVRIDKYLWAIRIFKTRSEAAEACKEGKVKLNNETVVKASRVVKPNENYHIKTKAGNVRLQTLKIIDKRVKSEIALTCYIDLTPPEEKERKKLNSVFYFSSGGGGRGNKQARPTKRDRRLMEKFKDSNV
ncbi:MAG: RNA-binding S4 domain-containing protein [Bacteroidia bacterium]|nr:RNA-binding S4 domain-containing protein [Bacteroidia bacterium]